MTAAEKGEYGNERGAFTTALLEGLRGHGRAKAWDSTSSEYVVRVDRLLEYVENQLRKQQVLAESDTARRLIQIPRLSGERGGRPQPDLARFSDEEVSRETLEVYLNPSEIVSVAEVTVERDLAIVESRTQLTGLPVSFNLRPMEYGVRAKAANYESVQKRWLAELYDPQEVTVRLAARSEPTESIGGLPEQDKGDLKQQNSGRQRGLGARPSPPESTKLVAESSDPLAPLEITDTTGVVLKTAQGRIESTDLGSGYYHVGIRMPEEYGPKTLVELSPGETEVVHLDAPEPAKTRLVDELLEDASVEPTEDNILKGSEFTDIGRLASQRPSTLVTLVGGIANRGESEFSTHRQSSLEQLRGFRSIVGTGAKSGLYIVFGFDAHNRDEAHNLLLGTKIRVWRQGEPVPEHSEHHLQFCNVSGLAEYAQPAVPGTHWVSIELPKQKPTVAAVVVLSQHLSMLVFDREAEGDIQLFQYLPRLERQVDVKLENLRQLELIQRFFLQGRVGRAYDLINGSPRLRQTDPLAECLAGYVLLRLGQMEELRATASTIVTSYPELSDGYILQAECDAGQRNDDAAVAAYTTALDRGVPTFAYGLVQLFGAVHKYDIQHPRVEVLTRVFRNRCVWLPGSTWIPKDGLDVGSRL